MLGTEVSPEVHNLPRPETNQNPCSSDAEPLDTVVGALVGVAELLFSLAEVVHFLDDFLGQLLDTAEFSLDGLKLLGGLDGAPVFGVGADVDVEFDMARGRVGSAGYVHQSVGIKRSSSTPGTLG